jgi:hypothetical protein
MMGQVMNMWIVLKDGRIKVLYRTIYGKYYFPSHIVGEVYEITKEEATKLINE